MVDNVNDPYRVPKSSTEVFNFQVFHQTIEISIPRVALNGQMTFSLTQLSWHLAFGIWHLAIVLDTQNNSNLFVLNRLFKGF